MIRGLKFGFISSIITSLIVFAALFFSKDFLCDKEGYVQNIICGISFPPSTSVILIVAIVGFLIGLIIAQRTRYRRAFF